MDYLNIEEIIGIKRKKIQIRMAGQGIEGDIISFEDFISIK